MSLHGSFEGPGTILGGLPVIAVIDSGKDADTPISDGEYWNEVRSIHWRKQDGTKGKELSEVLIERAEKHDHHFCDLCDQVFDHIAHERWLAAQGIEARSDTTEGHGAVRKDAPKTNREG